MAVSPAPRAWAAARLRSSRQFGLPVMSGVLVGALSLGLGWDAARAASGEIRTSASTTAAGHASSGARDGDRFTVTPDRAWRGAAGETGWWWAAEFAQPTVIGAILQITGDHPFVLRNVPRRYLWQVSRDGLDWRDLPETRVHQEPRAFRILRFKRPRTVRAIRLKIEGATGDSPVLREVEFFARPDAAIEFPDWIVAVNTTHDGALPGHGEEFIPLAKSVAGRGALQAQQVWLEAFRPDFIRVEPRPLAAFLSGNFKDWCEVDRSLWRGAAQILRQADLPIWASCGGAQGLAILAETGVDKRWDCPHCRQAQRPLLPIYGHIGHTGPPTKCGDYSACVHERGPHEVVKVGDDPVFAGLPEAFQVMQSHCGQIEWPPAGWSLIATAGKGTLTKLQCLRVKGRPIYAAQFHIEMAGTPENSRRIMGNFLDVARAWRERPAR
jgi:hypothetical protein